MHALAVVVKRRVARPRRPFGGGKITASENLKMGVHYIMTILSGKKWIPISFIMFSLTFACSAWGQQATLGGLVPISELGTASAIPKPTLTPFGGKLILSDSPEQITNTSVLPGAMYRDQVQGQFRVFYHHQNVSSATVNIGVAITNTTSEPELLFARGQGRGLNLYPDVAGQSALSEFISSHNSVSFLKLLSPGETYWSVQSVPQNDTASAILEYVLITKQNQTTVSSLPLALLQDLSPSQNPLSPLSLPAGFGSGAATVTTAAYSGQQPSDPTTLSVLPSDGHTRGTFPHFDRFGKFAIGASAGLQELSVDTAPPGHPYSNDMPGEYELGVDAVDGGNQVYDGGNYGVLYYFQILIQNVSPTKSLPFGLLMQPSGGFGHYVMYTDGSLALSPYVSYTHAWWFHELTVHGPSTIINLQTSLTGGSYGPQKLLFDPGFTGQ